MARIRSLKPEFWVSEQVGECSTSARLTFVGMWTFCDDQGVHPAKPKTLKAELFPMDDISSTDVAGWVEELVKAGLVAQFTGRDGERYWHVTGWAKHQKIDKPSFKYPAPPTRSNAAPKFAEDSPNSAPSDRQPLAEGSPTARRAPSPGVESSGVESSGVEGSGRESHSPKARRAPKTAIPEGFAVSERVKAWAADKGFGQLDAHLEHFIGKAKAKAYTYADWDEGLMGAIRDDWAGLRKPADAGRTAAARVDYRAKDYEAG